MKRIKKASSRRMRTNDGTFKSGNSNYARKMRWLFAHEPTEPMLWGFMVPEPKPWKSA